MTMPDPRDEAVRLANAQKIGLSGLPTYDPANYDARAMKRKIKLDKESREVIERQLDAFRQKFGREPGPEDPIFFDPDAETPQEYPEHKFQRDWSELMDEAARSGAIRPELAYAAKKTGFIVTETNKEKLSKQQLEEWDNAVQAYLDSTSRKIHRVGLRNQCFTLNQSVGHIDGIEGDVAHLGMSQR